MGVFEILKKAFFACLNLADFVTDTLVLLRLSCFLDSDKGQPCTGSVSSTCQSHPWWTGIGFAILLVSTFFGCLSWVRPEDRKYRDLHSSQRTWRRYLPIAGLYLIAFLQLSPFVDLFDLIKNGVDPEKKKASMRRDMRTKTLESGPQALFQSYIMFSLGSQRELLNVLSIAVSILSLSLGMVDFYMQPADAEAGEEKVEDTQGPDIITSGVQGEVVGARQDETATEEAAADVTLDVAGPDLIGSSPEVKVVGATENDMHVSQKQLLRSSTRLPPHGGPCEAGQAGLTYKDALYWQVGSFCIFELYLDLALHCLCCEFLTTSKRSRSRCGDCLCCASYFAAPGILDVDSGPPRVVCVDHVHACKTKR